MEYRGNKKLLQLFKTAFLCSRRCPAAVILKCYDWAQDQRAQGNCIACGNHSTLEKDVFDILLRGSQPLILILARGMKTRWEPAIEQAVEAGRLLIISPFGKEVKRVTRETAEKRNLYLIEISDEIVIGHIYKGGQLEKLLSSKKYVSL